MGNSSFQILFGTDLAHLGFGRVLTELRCIMTRYCSWCGLYMGLKSPIDDPSISHGICLKCCGEVIDEAKRKEKQNSLDNDHQIAKQHPDAPQLSVCHYVQGNTNTASENVSSTQR
jgi:hypothetical protein